MSSCSAATISLTPGITVTPDKAVAGRLAGSAARPAFPVPPGAYSQFHYERIRGYADGFFQDGDDPVQFRADAGVVRGHPVSDLVDLVAVMPIVGTIGILMPCAR